MQTANPDTDAPYDLLVVGGGIQGAWIALEAARAGERVALIEKEDFGSGTSANSLKVLHGGLRYLQHGNLKRIRESRRSVRSTQVVAGDLIEDRAFFLETRGYGVRGPWAMRAALLLYGMLCRLWRDGGPAPGGRVFAGDPSNVFPGGKFSPFANGVARWNEAVMRNSERVVFEVIRAAEREGAQCRNYCEKIGLEGSPGDWRIRVHDHRRGDSGVILARRLVEATGPSVESILGEKGCGLLRGVNLVFQGIPFDEQAVGLESREDSNDPDALVQKGNRLLFFVPHEDQTMVGTWYNRVQGMETEISEEEISSWLEEIEAVAPGRGFTRRNLRYVHSGLLPADERVAGVAQPAKESEIFEVDDQHLAVRTVKFTTAPEVARDALKRLGIHPAPRLTPGRSRVAAGPPFPWDSLLREEADVDPAVLMTAIEEEKILHLDDALLRRSNIVLDDFCTAEQIERAAVRLSSLLGWDESARRKEVARVWSRLATHPTKQEKQKGVRE